MAADAGHYSFAHQHHAYRGRGEYVTYLQRLAGLVGPDRLLVLDSADLFTAVNRSAESSTSSRSGPTSPASRCR